MTMNNITNPLYLFIYLSIIIVLYHTNFHTIPFNFNFKGIDPH